MPRTRASGALDTCFNCGHRARNLVLVWSPGGTFRRCPDQAACKARLGPCARCGARPDRHDFVAIPGGNGRMAPNDHGFVRRPEIQALVDAAYGVPATP